MNESLNPLPNTNWPLNKAVVKFLQGEFTAALLLAELVEKRDMALIDNALDEQGAVTVLNESIEQALFISPTTRKRLISLLKDKNLIEVSIKITPTKNKTKQTLNWYTINDKLITSLS